MNELTQHSKSKSAAGPPWRVYCVEALASAGTNLLITAIFFYTTNRFHWVLKQNFLLASGQGCFYIAGAMIAGRVAAKLNRHAALSVVYTTMGSLALLGFIAGDRPWVVTILLLAYSFSSTVGWPIMESLVSTGVDSHALSRRVSTYNLVWSAVGVVMMATAGTLIVRWPAGIFLVPATVHGISAVAMLLQSRTARRGIGNDDQHSAGHEQDAAEGASIKLAASQAEPELLRVRTLALWLSRVALPATYVVIFSLMALMPYLPIMHELSPAMQTLLGSTWMATRFLAFLLLGLGSWWHTRPRLLLIAAIVMLAGFFAVTVRPSDIFGHGSPAVDLLTMIVAQLALGFALGVIYTASLYFGMVLSEGSTEHGGYHEALIGVGFVVGPAAGALAQILRPGSIYHGIAAVGAVVFLSVIAVAVTAIVGNRTTNGTR